MIKFLDCTLRDGGYYNKWNFSNEVIESYIDAMISINIDSIEFGFRSLKQNGYRGGCGYSRDEFINKFDIPDNIDVAVMVNASEIINYKEGISAILNKLFIDKKDSRVNIIRIAAHFAEIEQIIPAIDILKDKGYIVSINLMQIADRTEKEIKYVADVLAKTRLDIFYFADSMGGLLPEDVSNIIKYIKTYWKKDIGFHGHDNICLGVNNSMIAIKAGAKWVDGTVTGMGRGPGNAPTEYLLTELDSYKNIYTNPTRLYSLISAYFKPMQIHYGWGTNPFYYIAGKRGIHPTYIQQMIDDVRYTDEDIINAIERIGKLGSKKYSVSNMELARHFFTGTSKVGWCPESKLKDREILILGTGKGVLSHQDAIETYISKFSPLVIALNTRTDILQKLIDLRVACHPIRLMADCNEYNRHDQPLIAPLSQLPDTLRDSLKNTEVFDYGVEIQSGEFIAEKTSCIIPVPLVIAYCLALATSGKASNILMAGFDGYGIGDMRNAEMNNLINIYRTSLNAKEIYSITDTEYDITEKSIYSLL